MLFEDVVPKNKKKKNKMSSDMRSVPDLTRKPCYRKADRAMRPRPIYTVALKIFGSP